MTEYSVREQRGWYIYDWANSAFVTTGVALFLGPYLTALAKAAADANGLVHPLRIPVDARSYCSYLVSLSVILQVLVLPIVGALADYGHRKKQYLAVTACGRGGGYRHVLAAGERICGAGRCSFSPT